MVYTSCNRLCLQFHGSTLSKILAIFVTTLMLSLSASAKNSPVRSLYKIALDPNHPNEKWVIARYITEGRHSTHSTIHYKTPSGMRGEIKDLPDEEGLDLEFHDANDDGILDITFSSTRSTHALFSYIILVDKKRGLIPVKLISMPANAKRELEDVVDAASLRAISIANPDFLKNGDLLAEVSDNSMQTLFCGCIEGDIFVPVIRIDHISGNFDSNRVLINVWQREGSRVVSVRRYSVKRTLDSLDLKHGCAGLRKSAAVGRSIKAGLD